MDKAAASLIMKTIAQIHEKLNELAVLDELVGDEKKQQKYRRAVGEAISHLYTGIQIPIIREYPDLDPDRQRDSNDHRCDGNWRK